MRKQLLTGRKQTERWRDLTNHWKKQFKQLIYKEEFGDKKFIISY